MKITIPEDDLMAIRASDRTPELNALMKAVWKETGVTQQQLVGKARGRRSAMARQMFMALAYRKGFTTTQIGRVLNRDASTVLHGIKAHEARLAQYKREKETA